MGIRSTNYPVNVNGVAQGVHDIIRSNCSEQQTVISRQQSYPDGGVIDLSKYAAQDINLDGVQIPEISNDGEYVGELPFTVYSTINIDGRFVAAMAGGYVGISSDGKVWNSKKVVSDSLIKIRYLNGAYYFTGFYGSILRSEDLDNFELVARFPGYRIIDIDYGNGIYAAVSSNNGEVFTSTDGFQFTQKTTLGFALNFITFGLGVFMVGGYGNHMYSTADFDTFTESPEFSYTLNGCYFIDNNFIAVGVGGYIYYFTDFNNVNRTYIGGFYYSATIGYNGIYYIITASEGNVLRSTNYKLDNSWSVYKFENGLYINSQSFNDNVFLVTSSSGFIALSYDKGVTFDVQSGHNYTGIVLGDLGFVGVADDGTIINSPDGDEYDSQELINAMLYSIAFGNGTYVACGSYLNGSSQQRGLIVYSTDARNWTRIEFTSTSFFKKVRFINGQFYVVGMGLTPTGVNYLISATGDAFTSYSINIGANSINDIAYNPVRQRYFIVCDGGIIRLSADSISYDDPVTINHLNHYGAASMLGAYVAVGESTAEEIPQQLLVSYDEDFDYVPGNGKYIRIGSGDYQFNGGITVDESTNTMYIYGNGIVATTKDLQTFSIELISRIQINDIYAYNGTVITIGNNYILKKTEFYGQSIVDSGLLNDYSLDDEEAYTIAYDYNTSYVSDIGDRRLNNNFISHDIVPGQLISLSYYDINCSNFKTIRASLDGEEVGVSTSNLRAMQYWLDTTYLELEEASELTLEIDDNTDVHTIIFNIIPPCRIRYVLYYVNKLGGLDTLVMKGEYSESDTFDRTQINTNYDRSLPYNFQYKTILHTDKKTVTLNTGYLNNEQSSRMDHILCSPKMWLHDIKTGLIHAAYLDSTSFSINRHPVFGNKLNNYGIQVTIAQDIIRRG